MIDQLIAMRGGEMMSGSNRVKYLTQGVRERIIPRYVIGIILSIAGKRRFGGSMLARFYIEDSDFTGVEVLKHIPDAQREHMVGQIELRTELVGFLIFTVLLIAFAVSSLN